MAAVSVITAASLPLYSILFHSFGVVGLAWASDIGIGANLLALGLAAASQETCSARGVALGRDGEGGAGGGGGGRNQF